MIFISYLGIASLDIDTTRGYYSQRECLKAAEKDAADLYEALKENTPLLEGIKDPYIQYKCEKLPLRDA